MERLGALLGYFGVALRQCSWCRCLMGVKRGPGITHGMCPRCARLVKG